MLSFIYMLTSVGLVLQIPITFLNQIHKCRENCTGNTGNKKLDLKDVNHGDKMPKLLNYRLCRWCSRDARRRAESQCPGRTCGPLGCRRWPPPAGMVQPSTSAMPKILLAKLQQHVKKRSWPRKSESVTFTHPNMFTLTNWWNLTKIQWTVEVPRESWASIWSKVTHQDTSDYTQVETVWVKKRRKDKWRWVGDFFACALCRQINSKLISSLVEKGWHASPVTAPYITWRFKSVSSTVSPSTCTVWTISGYVYGYLQHLASSDSMPLNS